MDYLEICNWVMRILTTLVGLLTIHFVVFMVVGLFTKKKYQPTDEKKKYAVIVSARNEEAVIANLVESVCKNKYPQDKITIFVVAHNCTDSTAQRARDAGAIVYEYNNENERTKGYALKYLFSKIKEDYGIEAFDGYLMLDSDNLLDVNYIERMNEAFVAHNGKNVIVSYRNSKNFGTNIISCLYGLFFLYGCRFEQRGRTVCNCSTRISGTGFLMSANTMKDGWNYVTLTEDWEFTADQIAQGNKIYYCDDAVFYDEQPVGLKVMFRQRLRWSRGHTLVWLTRYGQVLKSLFSPVKKGGSPHKISCYDISVNILPLGVISLGLTFVQMILLAIAPAFGYAAWPIWKDFFISAAESLAGSYLLLMLSAILLFVIERKRIPQMSFGVRLGAVLCMPLFMALSIPLDFISFFVKNLSWKTIPHIDTTNIDTIHQTVGLYKTDKKAETVPQNDIPNDFDLQKGVSDEQI